MKTAHDPRHIKRREIVKALFAETFTHQDQIAAIDSDDDEKFGDTELNEADTKEILHIVAVITKLDKKLDLLIQKSATEWPIDKLNKIDLAILRLAIYELMQKENPVPPKVVIDEAVELSKEFGSETTSSFVNGVLGTVLKELENGKE
jgi:N utilization substance protein B